MKNAVSRFASRVPENLIVFLAAIFLSNAVNVFTTMFGADTVPARWRELSASSGLGLVAAGLWTFFAAMAERIERAAAVYANDESRREIERRKLWQYVWLRAATVLSTASLTSIASLGVLALGFSGK